MPRRKVAKQSKTNKCERLTQAGKPCGLMALLKKDHCPKHPRAPRYDGEAKSLTEVADSELNTVEQVRKFLRDVIMVVKNGGDPEQRHKGLVELSKQIIAAIKERDANSPEAQERELNKAKAQQVLVTNMTIVDAKQLLMDRNLLSLEQKMVEVDDVTEIKTIQPSSD